MRFLFLRITALMLVTLSVVKFANADSLTVNLNITAPGVNLDAPSVLTLTLNGDGTISGNVISTNPITDLGFNASVPVALTGLPANYVQFGASAVRFGGFDVVINNAFNNGDVNSLSFLASTTGRFSSVFQLANFSVGNCCGSPATEFYILSDPANAIAGGDAPVPEPSSILLLGTSLIGAIGTMRRRFPKGFRQYRRDGIQQSSLP